MCVGGRWAGEGEEEEGGGRVNRGRERAELYFF